MMLFAFRAGLLLAFLCLVFPTLANPGAMRWSDATLKTTHTVASPDGSLVAIERGFGKIALYRTGTFTKLCEISVAAPGYPSYVFSPDNTLFAVSINSETCCYAVATGALVGTCPGTAWAFTAQGTLVTTNFKDIVFYNPRTSKPVRGLSAIDAVLHLALSPKRDLLAYMTPNALVLANTMGKKLYQWPLQPDLTRVLTFSSDGSLLAGNNIPGQLNVWRVADGALEIISKRSVPVVAASRAGCWPLG